MVRSGLGPNLSRILAIILLTYAVVVFLFYIVFNELPLWLGSVAG